MLKIGINGLGRIGRAILRINALSDTFKIVAINDTNPSNENLKYMLKYDSTYGVFDKSLEVDDNSITIAIGLLFVGVGMIISSFFVGKK